MPARVLRRLAAGLVLALAVPGAAGAHAVVSPAVSLAKHLQYYTLAVPTEKENATTSRVQITFPDGLSVDSFAPPPPGWKLSVAQSGSGESATITQATFAGGRTPTGEDSVFGFLARPQSRGTYRFTVEQTYSDGSIVNWNGPESAESPAPTTEAKDSLGGGSGGTSALTYVALVLSVLGLLAGGLALTGGGRELA